MPAGCDRIPAFALGSERFARVDSRAPAPRRKSRRDAAQTTRIGRTRPRNAAADHRAHGAARDNQLSALRSNSRKRTDPPDSWFTCDAEFAAVAGRRTRVDATIDVGRR